MSELILDKYTFYPICKNLQGKVVTFFRTKKQTEKTSQNLYTRSTFMIEDAKDLDSEVFPGFTLSYTNFSDVLFVQDIGYSELKRMKGELSWPTFCHQLQGGILALTPDKIAFADESHDLLYVHVGSFKFEMYEEREESARAKRLIQISFDMANFTQELQEELKSKDVKVDRLARNVEVLKSKQSVMDDPETNKSGKKRKLKEPKNLVNPNSKRVKPIGVKFN